MVIVGEVFDTTIEGLDEAVVVGDNEDNLPVTGEILLADSLVLVVAVEVAAVVAEIAAANPLLTLLLVP